MAKSQNNMLRHYQQLQPSKRGKIETLGHQHKTAHTIAKILHRSPSTITRELARGTTTQIDAQRHCYYQAYFVETDEAVYRQHRAHCHPQGLLKRAAPFFKSLMRTPSPSPLNLHVAHFKQTYLGFVCPSVPTVYRYIDQGRLALCNHDLPKKLRRRRKRPGRAHTQLNKKILGQSIENRPAVVQARKALGLGRRFS